MSQVLISNGQTDRILTHIRYRNILSGSHKKSIEDGSEIFDFTTHADKDFSQYINGNNRAIIEGEDGEYLEFIIYETQEDRIGRQLEVYCYASYAELNTSRVIPEHTTESLTVGQHAGIALNGTEWMVGTIESNAIRKITFESRTNPYKYLLRVASVFDLELSFRIEHSKGKVIGRYVDLLNRVGRWRGRRVEFGKDLIGIKRIDTAEIVTALNVIGPPDENGNRLEVIVEDESALQRWSRNGKHIIKDYEPQFSAEENATEGRLIELGNQELAKRINSIVSFEGTIADLENVPGLEHKKIRLGDTIQIKDTSYEPALYLDARIFYQDRDIKSQSQKQVKLGDFREYTEEEVQAIWKQLQLQINAKIGLAELQQRTYEKATIDNKDNQVRSDVETYANTVSSSARDEAITYTNNTLEPIVTTVNNLDKEVTDLSINLDDNNTRLSNAESSISQAMDEISFKVDATYVQGAIDGIEFDGRNVVKDSRLILINPNSRATRPFSNEIIEEEIEPYVRTTPIQSNEFYVSGYRWITDDLSTKLYNDTEYTLSAMIRVKEASEIQIQFRGNVNGLTTIGEDRRTISSSDGWVKFSVTFSRPDLENAYGSSNTFLINVINRTEGAVIEHKNFQIEKGTKATGWSPAPEDTDAVIADVQSQMNIMGGRIDSKAEATVVTDVAGRVSTAEQSINALSQEIVNKVDTTIFNGLNDTVTQLSSTVTQTEEDVQYMFEEIDAVGNAINNAVTTIDGNGVTVSDGSFFLRDSNEDFAYSLVNQPNIVKDYSLRMVEYDSSTTNTSNDWADMTTNHHALFGYEYWYPRYMDNPPRTQLVTSTHTRGRPLIVNQHRPAVSVTESYNIKRGAWLTFSAKFLRHRDRSRGTPVVNIYALSPTSLEFSTGRLLETFTGSVVKENPDDITTEYFSFKLPNNIYPDIEPIGIEITAATGNYVKFFDVQLYEGTHRQKINLENSFWGLLSGGGTSGMPASDITSRSLYSNNLSTFTNTNLYIRAEGETRSTFLGSNNDYIPHRASSHPTSSSILYKSHIEDLTEYDTMRLFNSATPKIYRIESDLKRRIYDKPKVGFISETVPQELRDEDGVDPYSIVSVLWNVVKIKHRQLVNLEERVNELEELLKYII